MKILIISNGYGEDHIACNLINAIKQTVPQAEFITIPLVGEGHAYKSNGLKPIIKNKILPSGGFIRRYIDLIKDIISGLFFQIITQFRTIKKESKSASFTICVGDVFCLLMGASLNKNPTFFLPTAKSNRFMPHSSIEYWLIERLALFSFPRDKETTSDFEKHKCKAYYFGNPMMDNLLNIDTLLPLDPNRITLGILPGSREEAYLNFEHCIKIIETLSHKHTLPLQFVMGKAATIDLEKISYMTGYKIIKHAKNQYLVNHDKNLQVLVTDAFTSVINQANLILGLSGTANEQATYIGKPVICFEGFGPQTTYQRFKEQEKLLGAKLKFIVNNEPENVADFIWVTIHDLQKSTEKPPKHKKASPLIVKTILENV